MKVEKCCYPTRNSRLGRSLRRARTTFKELRASAAPQAAARSVLRTNSTSRQARSRADGPATLRSSPPPGGGGCGLPIPAGSNLRTITSATIGGCGPLRPAGAISSFKISYVSFSGRSLRRSHTTVKKLRASAAPPCCGTHGPGGPACGIDSIRGSPAAGRTGLHERREPAALSRKPA